STVRRATCSPVVRRTANHPFKGKERLGVKRLVAGLLWVVMVGAVSLAQAPGTEQRAVELRAPLVRPILAAALNDRSPGDVILNRGSLAECGRLLVVGRPVATHTFARALPLDPDPETGAPRSLPGLLLPHAWSHLVFPVPRRFDLDEGTLAVTWQRGTGLEEFGALFCSDSDTAFQAFFAEGKLHFRVAGGQVSVGHRPKPGECRRYRFLWQRSVGRRAIFIDDQLVAEEEGGAWQDVAVGKELFFNARANLAFPGRGGAPGFYARILIYDRALLPEPPVTAQPEDGP
ncbi:MAG: hypothetical protein KAX80_06415, partial [Planctomycetes bacterium]|nr:hypothetical protein [Planctomycetota bacterium]